MTRHIAAFAVCFVVGALVGVFVIAAREAYDLPRSLLADSRGSTDVPWILGGALVFASACTVIRAFSVRTSRSES